MFDQILVEKNIAQHPKTKEILAKFANPNIKEIEDYSKIFGRVYKPHHLKYKSMNLFLAQKKGQLVKKAPDAYGVQDVDHYYFVHAYNCIYDCQYCYLQGYFNSPDMVLFVNHEEIIEEIKRVAGEYQAKGEKVWFHAGEFSDSLAISGLTNEWPMYWDCFAGLKNAYLELRTKSNNIRSVESLPPTENIVVTFSLSPDKVAQVVDHKTPPIASRLQAIKKLAAKGHQIGIHFDPVVHLPDLSDNYKQLIAELLEVLPLKQLNYISIGALRFSARSYQAVKKNFGDSGLFDSEWIKGFDGKYRYIRPLRTAMLNKVKEQCLNAGINPDKVYLCMESGE